MKKTIQSRITLVLIAAIALIALIGGLSLYYFTQISTDIDQIIKGDIRAERSAEKIKGLILDLRNAQKIYFEAVKIGEEPIDIERQLEDFEKALQEHQTFLLPENTERHNKISQLTTEYRDLLQSIQPDETGTNAIKIRSAEKKMLKISKEMRSLISELLSTRYDALEEHQGDIRVLISKAHRNMLLLFGICAFGGLFLIILAPTRVTAPFKRYISAINEVEDLKFETQLPVTGHDEVAQLGKSINRLIHRFSTFDEIKRKRIRFEKSKQRVLANMLDLGVMMMAIEGEVLFMNAQLAKILNLNTEEYQGKDYKKVSIPEELKEMISEVLKKKERLDSRMMILNYVNKNGKEKIAVEVLVDVGLVRNYQGNVVNLAITFEDITNPPGQSVFKRISIIDQELI